MATIIIGNPITITINVISPNPHLNATGIVVLVANEETVATKYMTGGSITFTIDTNKLGVGNYNFVGFYTGDMNFAPGESAGLLYDVETVVNTSCVVVSSSPVAAFGQAVTFTCTITAGQPVTQGTVSFYDSLNPSPIGFATNITQTSTGGIATFTTSTLVVGTYNIYAIYSGGGAFTTSTSPNISQTVNEIIPTVVVSVNVNPSFFNNPINITARVSGPSSVPLGSIIISDSNLAISGAITLSGGVGVLSGYTALAGGSHSLTAAYTSTDMVYDNATSAIYTQLINAGATTTVLTSSANPGAHGSVTFTATVTSASSGTPNGYVVFKNGGVIIGASTGYLLNGSGIAISPPGLLSAGTYNITATYLGTADYANSVSNILVQVLT